jgi:hypothetical protein
MQAFVHRLDSESIDGLASATPLPPVLTLRAVTSSQRMASVLEAAGFVRSAQSASFVWSFHRQASRKGGRLHGLSLVHSDGWGAGQRRQEAVQSANLH